MNSNIVRSLCKILQWNFVFKPDGRQETVDPMFNKDDLKLTKIRVAMTVTNNTSKNATVLNSMIESKEILNFEQMSILKQKILLLMHSLLEKQNDETSLKKMKKDLDFEVLKKVMTEIYYTFAAYYKKDFRPSLLKNDVNIILLRKKVLQK